MKKGWISNRLGAITTKIGSGATPRGGEESYKESGTPLIRSLNVHDWGFKKAKLARIDDAQAAQLSNVVVEPDDVLLNITGASVARCCVAPSEFLPARVNQHVSIIRPRKDEVSSAFLQYLLISQTYKDRLLHTGEAGSTRQAITKAQIEDFIIEYPKSLPEQHRIVSILDEAFAGLATAKANAEKNLHNARALFESHLQSVFSQRGKGWVEKKLENLGAIRTGKRDANHQVEDGPYPFYTCAFGQFKSPTFSFDGPSIILPGNGANVGKVFFHDGKFEAYQRTYVVNELSQVINPRFLYFCFSANWPGWIATKQFGSATNYIVVGDLKAFPVPTPSLPLQAATVEQLESFTEETQRLAAIYQQKLAALEALKKSLLHQAFSGEL